MAKAKQLKEKLYSKIAVPATPDGCWIFTGSTAREGYGTITHNKKSLGAHRVSYEIHVGEIPKGHLLRHKCDVRACCNPEHLETGTHADNMRDRMERQLCYNCKHPIN